MNAKQPLRHGKAVTPPQHLASELHHRGGKKIKSPPLMRGVASAASRGRDPQIYIKDVINLSDPDRSKQKQID